jgi:hypothetical protein
MSDKIDPVSGVLGLTAALLGFNLLRKNVKGEELSREHLGAFAAATLSLVAYDRWYDGMWPFLNEDAPGRVHYGAVTRRNPG